MHAESSDTRRSGIMLIHRLFGWRSSLPGGGCHRLRRRTAFRPVLLEPLEPRHLLAADLDQGGPRAGDPQGPAEPLVALFDESRQLTVPDASVTIATGLFRQVLQRDPNPRDLARVTRQLDAGRSVRDAARMLYVSPEFRRGQVTSYYVELLDREPAAAELRRGTRALVAGRGEGLVIGAIAGTAEYYVRSGGSNESFVRSLYVDLLGRQADAAGLARCTSRLDVGAVRPAGLTAEFVRSAEFRRDKVREVYQVVLDRAPTDAELNGWVTSWETRGGLRNAALGVLGGAENVGRLRRGEVAAPDTVSADQLRRIQQAPYTEASGGFVNLFNDLLQVQPKVDDAGDPIPSDPGNMSLWNLLRNGGATDGRPSDEIEVITPISANVAALVPLQSEIDMDKSLKFPLSTDPQKSDLASFLDGGTILPFGGPVITGGEGSYIVDGHHRWSSIYVLNPYARIAAYDLGNERAPQDYLKITQLAIGATLGFLPVQSVDGSNLFTISREAFEQWVEKTIAEGEDPRAVLQIFSDKKGLADAAAVADYLWANVERMRQFNLPLPGVTSRDFMPQPSGDIQPILHLLESGRLNFRAPVMARLG